eukprot:6187367-Pleurochrysis_carterae.AAC.3
MPRRWARYISKHNALADFTAQLVSTAHEAGLVWAVENPADCDAEGSVAWWPRFATHAPLWVYPAAAVIRHSSTRHWWRPAAAAPWRALFHTWRNDPCY